jgi:hypothetical protein
VKSEAKLDDLYLHPVKDRRLSHRIQEMAIGFLRREWKVEINGSKSSVSRFLFHFTE